MLMKTIMEKSETNETRDAYTPLIKNNNCTSTHQHDAPTLCLNFVYLTDGIPHCKVCFKKICDISAHLVNNKHIINRMVTLRNIAFVATPLPHVSKLQKLDKLLATSHKEWVISRKEKASISSLVSVLTKRLRVLLRDPSLQLLIHGSVETGLASQESDVNLELVLNPNLSEITALKTISEQFQTVGNYNQRFDGTRKLQLKLDNRVYEISCCPNRKVTTRIIKLYCSIDPRVRILAIYLRRWARAYGFTCPDKGSWPAFAFDIMLIHFLQNVTPPVLPVLHREYPDINLESYGAEFAIKNKWTVRNASPISQLWIQLFHYYIDVFEPTNSIVSITTYDKKLNFGFGRTPPEVMFIEDPCTGENLSKFVCNKKTYRQFKNIWFRYYWFYGFNIVQFDLDDLQLSTSLNYLVDRLSPKSSRPEFDYYTPSDRLYYDRLRAEFGLKLTPVRNESHDFKMSFLSSRITNSAPEFCHLCRCYNHNRYNCRKANLQLSGLCPINKAILPIFYSRLDELCIKEFLTMRITPKIEAIHKSILRSVEAIVRDLFADARLQLYGSSQNRFGAKNSDLDMCLTVNPNECASQQEVRRVIKRVAKHLVRSDAIRSVLPITTARIPIVKFVYTYQNRKYECDLSLSNTFALHNTRLLRTYCELDERVAQLGLTIKRFAKECKICDSSKQSLSSYGYSLMTIHYLQNTSPPVLPVLQDIPVPNRPRRIEKHKDFKYDVWFFDDIGRLGEYWSHSYKNRNTASVGKLLLGFFIYFTESFDWENRVVSINTTKPVYKVDKDWGSSTLAIEDPFILDFNVGKTVTNQIALLILQCLRNARNMYAAQPHKVSMNTRSYFLNGRRLSMVQYLQHKCTHCSGHHYREKSCPVLREAKRKKKDLTGNEDQENRPLENQQKNGIIEHGTNQRQELKIGSPV